ncbi:hypothetical protein D210916BOD24_20450 [Alteromonas sp. D210916BOD_24]|uniref:hybrid sensor histidine kinase/response regulator n=1 Tax=Alteromonas sp. D210916BOD_24 TaxID=3157618 RepID=UPI00399C9218
MPRSFKVVLLLCLLLVLPGKALFAFELAELKQLEANVAAQSPMPIGDAIKRLEQWLHSDELTLTEKTHVGALYVKYQLAIHQRPDEEIFSLLLQLENNSPEGIMVSIGIARMHGISGHYKKSYAYFDRAIATPSIPPAIKAFGIIYQILTYSEAQVFAPNADLINTLNSILVENELHDLKPLYNAIVADYYQSISAYDIALEYYEESLLGAQQAKQTILVSENLYAIGILYRNTGEFDNAILYFKRAIDYDKNIDINYSEYLATYGLATTYFRAKRHSEALTLAEQVINHPLTSSFYDSEIYRLKAEAHLALDQLPEAKFALNKARQLYDDTRKDEQTTWRAQLEQTASLITAAEGDYKLAFEQYEKFHLEYINAKKYEDLELIESASLIQEIEEEKERAKQLEEENRTFEEALILKSKAQRTQALFSKLLIVLVTLTLITLVILLLLLKKSREANRLYRTGKEKAELHNRLKSEFISNISHELRTPLNAIIGFGEILNRKYPDTEAQQFSQKIVNASEMLLQLINDLLDFSKIEAGKLTLSTKPNNIHKCINTLSDIFSDQAQNKGLVVKLIIDEALNKDLMFDELRLKQVFANLISNAIKFSSKGTVEVGVSIANRVNNTYHLHCWVKDEGIGISKENQKKLFTPFTQAESSIARTYGGTGLGLNISNNLLKLMDSSLQLDSQLGQGCTFSFDVTFSAAESITEYSPVTQSIEAGFSKQRVLLAEDNAINVEVIKALLADCNLIIVHCSNGQQAIDAMRAHKFDVILMDVQMPEVDGLSATRVIRRELKSSIPIIALTANAMQQDINECLAAGMNSHVSKPIDKTRLIEQLRHYLIAPNNKITAGEAK